MSIQAKINKLLIALELKDGKLLLDVNQNYSKETKVTYKLHIVSQYEYFKDEYGEERRKKVQLLITDKKRENY